MLYFISIIKCYHGYLQIILALVLLWNTMGVSILSGLAIMVVMMPLNGAVAFRQRKLQVEQMRNKDERLKLINEVLNGIKVITVTNATQYKLGSY
jgi:hypothetical protein